MVYLQCLAVLGIHWPSMLCFCSSSSSSKSLLYVTFRHKMSFKWHYNTIKTLYRWWCEGGGDRAWWVIGSVFLRSSDKGFWACLGDIPPDMPRRAETWVSLCNFCFFVLVQWAIYIWFPRKQGHHPMLFQCWISVFDAGPTFKQHWVDVPCLLVDALTHGEFSIAASTRYQFSPSTPRCASFFLKSAYSFTYD